MAYIRRLKRLVQVLEYVRDTPHLVKEFDMKAWSSDVPECGTHYCACGWGALDPVLHKQGLSLSKLDKNKQWNGTRHRYLRYRTPAGVLYKEFEASEKFFGITHKQARNLFHPSSYRDDHDINVVIKRIKGVISRTQKK